MAHLNEIIEAKETLEKEMVCLASGENGIFGYEEAVKIAIEVMEDKLAFLGEPEKGAWMDRDFEKDIIELDAAIKSNAERDNTFTLSVLQRAKEIILQQKEKLKAYEDIGLTSEEILGRKMLAGWIPVVERTPEKPKENPLYDNKPLELYLVSVKNTDCVIRAFWNGASFTDGWEKLDVLAWMPLPEPYRPETLRGPGAKAGQDAAEPVFQSAT